MKKIITVMLLVVVLASFIACSGGEKNTEGNVTIDFFHRFPQEPRKSYFDKMIAEFEEANPNVTINVDYILNDSYKEKIRVLVASNDLPDVFMSWSGSFAQNLVSSENIMDLTSMYADDTEWSGPIMESQLPPFTFDGKIYGAPYSIDGKAFFYNKKIFDEYGLDVPATYNEFIDTLNILRDAGFESPIIEGLSNPWTVSHYLGTIFQRVLDEDVMLRDFDLETAEFTDPGYIRGLEMFKEFADLMGPNATAIDHETARNMFAAGEIPVMYMQFVEIDMNTSANPDLEMGFFNFPAVEGGKGDPEYLTGAPEGFMLSKDAGPEAIEFFKFLTSREQAYEFTADCGVLNAVEGAVDSGNASPQILEAYNVILNAKGSTPWFDNAVDIKIGDIFMRGGQSLATGDITPEEIMKQVQEETARLKS